MGTDGRFPRFPQGPHLLFGQSHYLESLGVIFTRVISQNSQKVCLVPGARVRPNTKRWVSHHQAAIGFHTINRHMFTPGDVQFLSDLWSFGDTTSFWITSTCSEFHCDGDRSARVLHQMINHFRAVKYHEIHVLLQILL